MLSTLLLFALAHGAGRESVRAREYNRERIALEVVGPDEFGGPRARRLDVVTFNVKDVRGGNGDVAAAYLTAVEWRERYAYRGRILFVTLEKSRRVLSRIVGRPVASRDRIDPDLEILDALQITPDVPPADLYVKLAAKQGEHENPYFTRNVDVRGHGFANHRVPVHSGTFHVTAPVFSSSEASGVYTTHLLLTYRGVDFMAPAPGPNHAESGIYYDADAAGISTWSEDQLRDSLVEGKWGGRLSPWLASGRGFGFAYGLSHPRATQQFGGYLAGLLHAAKGRKFVILTPSTVSPDDFDKFSPEELAIVSLDEPVPVDPKIVIVRLPDIDSKTFNRLLALSRDIPPIVAGDCALSAALPMGRRFAMTQVAWNQKIAAELYAELSTEAGNRRQFRALDCLARADLSPVMDLDDEPFAKKAERRHLFSDRLLMYVDRARRYVDEWNGEGENAVLRMRRSIERLRAGEGGLELAQFGFPNTFIDAFHRALNLQTIDARDVEHPEIRRNAEKFTDLRDDGSRELLWAVEGGREEEIERSVRDIAEKVRPFSPPSDHPDGWRLESKGRDALRALAAMGTERAFEIIRDHMVDFPFAATATAATWAWLNHLDDLGRLSEVVEFLAPRETRDLEALVDRTEAYDPTSFPRPNVVKALMDRGGLDEYRIKRLRFVLKKAGDCSSYLGEAPRHG